MLERQNILVPVLDALLDARKLHLVSLRFGVIGRGRVGHGICVLHARLLCQLDPQELVRDLLAVIARLHRFSQPPRQAALIQSSRHFDIHLPDTIDQVLILSNVAKEGIWLIAPHGQMDVEVSEQEVSGRRVENLLS